MTVPTTKFVDGNCLLDAVSIQLYCQHNPNQWSLLTERFRFLSNVDPTNFSDVFSAVERAYAEVWTDIVAARKRFHQRWCEFAGAWYKLLADVFEHELAECEVFRACVGVGSIGPRNIATQEFLIPFYGSAENACIVSAHETSHFYYYRSIGDTCATLGQSRADWLLSEMLVPVLFTLPQAVEVFPFKLTYKTYAASPTQVEIIRRAFLALRAKHSWRTTRMHLIRLISEEIAKG